jgi:hypothetical protein
MVSAVNRPALGAGQHKARQGADHEAIAATSSLTRSELRQPNQRHLHAVRRHAVPRISLVDWELPDRVSLFADVAHVRRGRVLRSLS